MLRQTAAALLAAALPASVLAEGIASETITFKLGAYVARTNTQIVANANGLPGSVVDFETDLGMGNSSTDLLVDINWRFAQRHRLELLYFDLSRSASKAIARDIVIDGTVYPIGTTVSSEFKSQVTALTYYYSLMQTPEYELALGIGIHNTTFKPSLATSTAGLSTSLSADVPLPVLALRGDMRLNENWGGSASVKWFGLSYGDYSGGLTTFNIGATYFFAKNWGVDVGYGYNRYNIDVTKPDWNGSLDYKFSGPAISLVGQF